MSSYYDRLGWALDMDEDTLRWVEDVLGLVRQVAAQEPSELRDEARELLHRGLGNVPRGSTPPGGSSRVA